MLFADPALPLDEAGKYVAGAYVVFLVLIVVYVAIMAAKLQRIERELRDLAGFAEQRQNATEASPGSAAEKTEAAPGSGSEQPSLSDSVAAHESGGGG